MLDPDILADLKQLCELVETKTGRSGIYEQLERAIERVAASRAPVRGVEGALRNLLELAGPDAGKFQGMTAKLLSRIGRGIVSPIPVKRL